jgi:hypothetical protein
VLIHCILFAAYCQPIEAVVLAKISVREIEKRNGIRFVVGDVKFPATRKLPEEQSSGNSEN